MCDCVCVCVCATNGLTTRNERVYIKGENDSIAWINNDELVDMIDFKVVVQIDSCVILVHDKTKTNNSNN